MPRPVEAHIKEKIRTWGDLGCYSFEENAIMTTGDGGMISTNDKKAKNFGRLHFMVGI